ncbi:MAG: 50S ribosomal protein L22 [Parcubacteria group bacterium]|nr:50S ribosomal protein L22 [Parcubacteria group bacterium]
MQEVTAQVRTSRIAPRKARLVVGLIRNKAVTTATEQLSVLPKRAAGIVLKLLNSAVASAKNNYKLDPAGLSVVRAFVDEGDTLKRWRPRAFGRAGAIRKRTSHITIILGEKKKATITKK